MNTNLLDKITEGSLIKGIRNNAYALFVDESKPFNLNIIGVRASNREAGLFDDALCVLFMKDGKWFLRKWPCTVDPSRYYLENPIPGNDLGTAILCPGQYRGVYKVDTHARGTGFAHTALCQRLGPVKIYRDNDKDEILDMDGVKQTEGFYGINIHRAHRTKTVTEIGPYSAGCTVLPSPENFGTFMYYVAGAVKAWGNRFTYTLLDESDIS